MPRDRPPEIHKLAADFKERYGDGGGGHAKYPVFHATFGGNEASRVRRKLAEQLRVIDLHRRDVQANLIVHDIIDPSLNARMLDAAEMRDVAAEAMRSISEGVVHRTNTTMITSVSVDVLRRHYRKYCWDKVENKWELDAVLDYDHGAHIQYGRPCYARDAWESGDLPWVAVPRGINDGLEFVVARYPYDGTGGDNARARDYIRSMVAHIDTVAKRGAFEWVPTRVNCSLDAKRGHRSASFGEIAGLPPRCFCPKVYENIESIFSQLLPLIARLPLSADENEDYYDTKYHKEGSPHPFLDDGTLQVVVKAQKYVLPPHSSYTGRWHTEGYSENIVAAAVYYIDVSNDTTGGNLSFRPKETPNSYYYGFRETTEGNASTEGDFHHVEREGPDVDETEWWHHYIRDIPVSSGTAAVFSNTIPHRFRTIHNDTDDAQERLFINFFIVDPDKCLAKTTISCPSRILLMSFLSQKGVTDPALQLTILSFCGHGFGGAAGPIKCKLLRDRARASMASNRPHWSILNYGNSGAVVYQRDSIRPFEGSKLGVEYGISGYDGNASENEHSGCNTSALGSGL